MAHDKCPNCGREMKRFIRTIDFDHDFQKEFVNCTCGFEMPADLYEQQIRKHSINVPPHYAYVGARIEDLCSAIVRCYTEEKPDHNKIVLWCKEILYLNEMDRNLRYDEKCKVWREQKDGTFKEMP